MRSLVFLNQPCMARIGGAAGDDCATTKDCDWRFPAFVSLDGQRVVIFDHVARAQPFCRALNALPGGTALCGMCDQSKFLAARRDGQALRYRCHAGLREFVIPVIRDGQTIALLQCGQVHDRAPSAAVDRACLKST